MSLITVQVGQCGNQLGQSLFSYLATEFHRNERNYGDQAWTPLFRCTDTSKFGNSLSEAPTARSILIDMEPKAVHCAMMDARAEGWKYSKERVLVAQSGSGNNWAAGYFHHGPRVGEQCIDLIRKEAECADLFCGIFMIHSVAGGTGSGLGAYLAESVSHEFPSTPVLSYCVWPYTTGEISVQYYNSLLSLSHLCTRATGAIVVENDMLHTICDRMVGIKRTGFRDINRVAAQALALALLPSRTQSICVNEMRPTRTLGDIVQHLCAHPSFPLMSIWSGPHIPPSSIDFTRFDWGTIMKKLKQAIMFGTSSSARAPAPQHSSLSKPKAHQLNKSVANFVSLRGTGCMMVDCSEIITAGSHPQWNPTPFMVTRNEAKVGNYELSAGLLSNSQASVRPPSQAINQAWNMYHSRAFLHQYERYGMDAAEFKIAFSYMEDIVAEYSQL